MWSWIMFKRSKMSRSHSKHLFTKTAKHVHGKNILSTTSPLRGGIRL